MCQISRDPNLYVMFDYGVCASSGGMCNELASDIKFSHINPSPG